jgi:hypothetical protein
MAKTESSGKAPIHLEDSKKGLSKKVTRWTSISIVSAIMTLGAWAFASPIGSTPDDDYHLVSIWCGQGFRDGICEEGTEPREVVVRETLMDYSFCYAGEPDETGECQQTELFAPTTRSNAGENPRVFYWATSWFASNDLTTSIISIRFFNSILIVLGFAAVIFALPRHLRRVPVVSAVSIAVPLGLFIIPSTNPSSWGVYAVVLFFAAFLGFVITKNRRSRWILGSIALVTLLMAAGSRPDSALYVLVAVAAVIIITFTRKMINPVNISIVAALMLMGAIFFFGSANTSATLTGAPGGGLTTFTGGQLYANVTNLPTLWVGGFGVWGLGWLDTPMSPIVWVVGWGVFLSLVFAAIMYFNLQQALSVSLIFAALVLVPILALSASGLIVGQFVQPRYLTGLLGMLVAASMFRSSMNTGLLMSRAQVWIIGFALMFAHIIALRTNLGRYLTGMSDVAENLDYGFEWWWVDRPASGELLWFSPNLVWITGSVALAVFLVSLWKLKAELGLPGYNEWTKETASVDSSVSLTKKVTTKRKTNSPKKVLISKKAKPRKKT